MPRKRTEYQEIPTTAGADLVERLGSELAHGHENGQPIILEQRFENGKARVTVIWDEWEPLLFEDRIGVILEAYEKVEGAVERQKIALASGFTFPEAYSAGLLPYEIIAARRSSDPFTEEQIREAMRAEGASLLFDPDEPVLRFASREDATAATNRLAQALPGSAEMWVIRKEMGRIEEWMRR